MNQRDDNVLLDLIRSGDVAAFRELFTRYYDPLCRFAHGFTRDHQLAEEAVSQIFEEMWTDRSRIKITVSVKAWLYGAAWNQCVDRIRSQSRARTIPIEAHHSEALADHETGRQQALRGEMQVEIERVISALPEQRQLVFRMNRLDGLRYKEIAEILGIAERTVQNHMVLAVQQIAPSLRRLRELMRSPR